MSTENLTKQNLKNIEGTIQLAKTKLEYAKEIAKCLGEQPERLPELLEMLEITEEDFYAYLSGIKKSDITFFDQALSLVKRKNIKEQKN